MTAMDPIRIHFKSLAGNLGHNLRTSPKPHLHVSWLRLDGLPGCSVQPSLSRGPSSLGQLVPVLFQLSMSAPVCQTQISLTATDSFFFLFSLIRYMYLTYTVSGSSQKFKNLVLFTEYRTYTKRMWFCSTSISLSH